jgi:hypothetical protein
MADAWRRAGQEAKLWNQVGRTIYGERSGCDEGCRRSSAVGDKRTTIAALAGDGMAAGPRLGQ